MATAPEASALYGQGGREQLPLYLFKQGTCWRRGGWMKQGISSPPPPPPPPPHCSAPSHSLHMFQRAQVADFYTNTFLNSLWHAKDGFACFCQDKKKRKKISILTCYSVKLVQEGNKRAGFVPFLNIYCECRY